MIKPRSLPAMLIAALCLSQLLAGRGSAQPSDDLRAGVAAYQRNDFKQAAALLGRATANGAAASGNATAHYYAGNALLRIGQRSQAAAHYRNAIHLNPGEPLASYCGQALRSCQPASSGSDSSPPLNPEGSPDSVRSPSSSRLEIDADDRKMIKVHRQTSETEKMRTVILTGLASVPKPVKVLLATAGVSVLITPTIREFDPESAQNKPRGYIHGGGYDNCPGFYSPSNKQIVIPERVSYRNDPPRFNSGAADIMLHEMGHAYDDNAGHLSRNESFRQYYAEENSRLNNSMRTQYYYYSQGGDTGPSELFAELFLNACAQRAGIQPRRQALSEYYQSCSQFVSKSFTK